jgi:hypothetical protein
VIEQRTWTKPERSFSGRLQIDHEGAEALFGEVRQYPNGADKIVTEPFPVAADDDRGLLVVGQSEQDIERDAIGDGRGARQPIGLRRHERTPSNEHRTLSLPLCPRLVSHE